VITADTTLEDQTYYLGNPDLTVIPTFSALFAESRCPLMFSYYVMDSPDIASFTTFNTMNG
jgi:hypothetical protein